MLRDAGNEGVGKVHGRSRYYLFNFAVNLKAFLKRKKLTRHFFQENKKWLDKILMHATFMTLENFMP